VQAVFLVTLRKPGVGPENPLYFGCAQLCREFVEFGVAGISLAAGKRSCPESRGIIRQANPYLPLDYVADVLLFIPFVPAARSRSGHSRVFRTGGQNACHSEQR